MTIFKEVYVAREYEIPGVYEGMHGYISTIEGNMSVTFDETENILDKLLAAAYTKEVEEPIINRYDIKIQELTAKIEALEKVNTEILDKLNYICERKKRSENVQYGIRG